jgi:hypothetical protein
MKTTQHLYIRIDMSTTMNIVSSDNKCNAIIKTGQKKGTVCNRPCKNDIAYCGLHQSQAIKSPVLDKNVSDSSVNTDLYPCTHCKYGKVTVTISYFGSNKTDTQSTWTCTDCKGTGKIDKKEHEFQEKTCNIWCECEDDTESYFVDNGEDSECFKHHWRCDECDKITQIG